MDLSYRCSWYWSLWSSSWSSSNREVVVVLGVEQWSARLVDDEALASGLSLSSIFPYPRCCGNRPPSIGPERNIRNRGCRRSSWTASWLSLSSCMFLSSVSSLASPLDHTKLDCCYGRAIVAHRNQARACLKVLRSLIKYGMACHRWVVSREAVMHDRIGPISCN